jgi:hypothetical protein
MTGIRLTDSFQHDNETSGSTEGWECLEQLTDFKL